MTKTKTEVALHQIDHGTGEVTVFKPDATKITQAKMDALATFAAKVQDWPLAERAIDAKIDDQIEFVRWWRENVRGDGRPGKTVPDLGLFTVFEAYKYAEITKQQVSKWAKKITDVEKYHDAMMLALRRKAELAAAANHRAEGTTENEWYTPAKYIEAARIVMGEIDLDPASNTKAQEWIKAGMFYTKKQNGLTRKWEGRVWLNPPFEQPHIQHFAEKIVAEVEAKHVTEAIMLTHNYTDTAWFHIAESACAAICFTRGRIKFVDADGDACAPTQGQAFFYYGDRPQAFARVFKEFGFVR